MAVADHSPRPGEADQPACLPDHPLPGGGEAVQGGDMSVLDHVDLPLVLLVIGGLLTIGGVGINLGIKNLSAQAPAERATRVLATLLGLALMGTSVLLYIRAPIGNAPAASASTASSQAAASASPAPVLRFAPLPEGPRPRCNQYAGTGRIPEGAVLVVYERAVGAQGEPIGQGMSVVGVAKNTQTGWQTPRMDHGADFVEVAAVLLDQAQYDYLAAQYVVRNKDGQRLEDVTIQTDRLPPGVVVPSLILPIDLKTPPCSS